MQFDELEELGFSIAFHRNKSILSGTPSTLNCLTPELVEYLYAVIVSCKLLIRQV